MCVSLLLLTLSALGVRGQEDERQKTGMQIERLLRKKIVLGWVGGWG